MWLDVQLKEADTVTGVRLLQRTDGNTNGVITKADIFVLKKGETEYKKVKTSDFNKSGWNIVTFEAEKDVTNVKIQALSTLGHINNRYASLAEIRILTKKEAEEVKPDKTTLKELVTKAEDIKKKKADTSNVNVLEQKIKEAKTILTKEDASWFDILLAEANLKKAIKDFEKKVDYNPGVSSPVVPLAPEKSEDKKIEDKKAEPKNTEEVDVPDDKTAQGTADTAKDDVSKTAKTLKKDKRILKVLNEVKAETKVLKALQKETSKKINIVKQLKNYRKTVNNDKKYLSVKKKLESAISFLEKSKITTTNSLLKKLANLNKQLKKLQASNKNVKNEAKIKKLQKEMANIKLVISSLEGAKKFFEK